MQGKKHSTRKVLELGKTPRRKVEEDKLLREENSGHDVPFVPDGTAEDLPTLKNVEAIEQDNGVMENEEKAKKLVATCPNNCLNQEVVTCVSVVTLRCIHLRHAMSDCAKLNFEKREAALI